MGATVFDLDDTLIDSGRAWSAACAAFTADHGHAWSAADSAALHGNGGWTAYVSGLCGGLPVQRVLDGCLANMLDTIETIDLLPGAAELTEEAARFGPLALVSASPRRFVEKVLVHVGLACRFQVVVCGEDVDRPKPAPDPYLLAVQELGLDAADCLAVEDSPHGIRSAHAAGLTVLAIPRHGDPLPADVAALAAHVACNAREALSLLSFTVVP
uniref:HAD family hydrolase n=1 Tax=Herbidospora sakaeratensis TaxID=564415 RepID=UPI000786479E|nr:HAD family phosphatase [Herbidospora sakaeratensis]